MEPPGHLGFNRPRVSSTRAFCRRRPGKAEVRASTNISKSLAAVNQQLPSLTVMAADLGHTLAIGGTHAGRRA